jgi:hypothetical protein
MRKFLAFAALITFALGTVSCSDFSGIESDFDELEGAYYEVLGKEKMYFRAEPDMSSPVTDSITTAFDYPRQYEPVENYEKRVYASRHFIIMDGAHEGWRKVGLELVKPYDNRHGRVALGQVGRVVRYVDEASFNKYAVGEYMIKDADSKIAIYSAPNPRAATGKSITSEYSDAGILDGYFQIKKADRAGWYMLAATEYFTIPMNNSGSVGTKYPYPVTTTRYLSQKELEENATPWIVAIEKGPGTRMDGKLPKYLIFTILGLLAIATLFMKRGLEEGKGLIRYCLIFCAVCVLELWHFEWLDAGTWFATRKVVGWWWTIAGFVIAVVALIWQIMMFWDVLEITGPKEGMGHGFGMWATLVWMGLVVLKIVMGGGSDLSDEMLWLFVILQGVHVISILVRGRRHFGLALVCSFVWLLGAYSLVTVVRNLAAAYVVVLVFMILGRAASESSSSSGSSDSGHKSDELNKADNWGGTLNRNCRYAQGYGSSGFCSLHQERGPNCISCPDFR